jgi:hypothetical protein
MAFSKEKYSGISLVCQKKWDPIYGALGMWYSRKGCVWLQKDV